MIIQCLIFDLDGIVIDSELKRDKLTGELVDSFGHKYNRDELKPQMSGKPYRECMQLLIDYYRLRVTAQELVQLQKPKILSLYRESIPFVPGFLSFFDSLRHKVKVPVAIATGCDKEYFEAIDTRLGITTLFDNRVFSSSDVGNSKPEPDIFLYAAKTLGVLPQNCLVFEDAPNGVVASIKAGCATVVLTRTYSEQVLVEKCSALVSTASIKKVLFIQDYSEISLQRVLTKISAD